ncbi:MAG TPA: CAP domain-containing protein [Bacteroidales bacterium]|nr:CAP domain-containing protein [Bacteroidales bacterium]
MFRKHLIRLLISTIIIIALNIPGSVFSQNVNNDLDYYTRLNEKEKRLEEYKDSREALVLKLEQLNLINASRKKFKATPLELDILASRVANKMSREAAENNFTGHWNLSGEKPYHRYAFAGGYDHVSENAYAEWSSKSFENNAATIAAMMKSGHESFMAERAPRDGHKKTVIKKEHNYVGIGFHLEGKQFRYYEEYLDRYFEFENINTEINKGEKTTINLKTDGSKFLYFMIVYYEDFPKKMKPSEITSKGSYADYTNKQYLTITSWDLAKFRNGLNYQIPLTLSKTGLYYIHIYIDDMEIIRPGTLNTNGKTPYSGIVISVTD